VLDALAAGARRYPSNPGRHRIEHAQVVDLDDLERFRRLGTIASLQPTHATSDMYWAEDRVGSRRIRGAYAWRRLVDLEVPLALGSDFPVEKANPMHGFYAAVTRTDLEGRPEGGWYPDQVLTRREALAGFTLGPAYAAFAEDQLGSLAVGKRADLVVLDRDILEMPAAAIPQTEALLTVVDGRVVHATGPMVTLRR